MHNVNGNRYQAPNPLSHLPPDAKTSGSSPLSEKFIMSKPAKVVAEKILKEAEKWHTDKKLNLVGTQIRTNYMALIEKLDQLKQAMPNKYVQIRAEIEKMEEKQSFKQKTNGLNVSFYLNTYDPKVLASNESATELAGDIPESTERES